MSELGFLINYTFQYYINTVETNGVLYMSPRISWPIWGKRSNRPSLFDSRLVGVWLTGLTSCCFSYIAWSNSGHKHLIFVCRPPSRHYHCSNMFFSCLSIKLLNTDEWCNLVSVPHLFYQLCCLFQCHYSYLPVIISRCHISTSVFG